MASNVIHVDFASRRLLKELATNLLPAVSPEVAREYDVTALYGVVEDLHRTGIALRLDLGRAPVLTDAQVVALLVELMAHLDGVIGGVDDIREEFYQRSLAAQKGVS